MQRLCVGRTRGSRASSTGFTEFEMAYVKRLSTKEESTNAEHRHVSAGRGGCKILTLHFRRHAARQHELVLKTFAQSRNRNRTQTRQFLFLHKALHIVCLHPNSPNIFALLEIPSRTSSPCQRTMTRYDRPMTVISTLRVPRPSRPALACTDVSDSHSVPSEPSCGTGNRGTKCLWCTEWDTEGL